MLSSPQHEAYFFAKLENPCWIEPLRARHVFDHPPKPEPVDGGGLRYPRWPPSKYLARMASHAPSEVAAIFAGLKTENVSVIGDLLTAALAMPADIAATLVPAVCRAARTGPLWLLEFTNAVTLCVRLADGRQVSSAMNLADALFEPKLHEGESRPRARDEYWYEKGLAKLLPILIALQPQEFLVKLCNWLNASVSAEPHVDQNTGLDHSCVWRPAIEEHAQNTGHGLPSLLIGFVRDGFEQAIRNALIALDEAFDILHGFHYLIFKRIRLYLINEFAERIPELVQRTIMDRGLFDDHQCKHEYAMLVGRRFNLLTPGDRETWFRWIDAGPDTSHLDSPSDEQRRNYVRYWQFEKLHGVREHLEGERSAFYNEMLAKHGKPKLADLVVYHESGWGYVSPMTVEELAKLNFPEVLDRVCSWKPTERGFREPEIEGLASTFERYVATDPRLFSTQARLLIGRRAIFVRTFIDQMTNAVKAGRDIDITSVLKLCDWVLTRPVSERTTPDEAQGALADKDWQWTRDQIADFVRGLCNAKVGEGPKFSIEGFRERFWSLVGPLCRDRTESYILRDVSQDDPRVRDYLDLAINSPRGKALEAALAYARWVANHIKETGGEHEVVPGGFDAMSEVREMLEWQIEPDNRSVEALAIIGSNVNLIYWIDKDWLAANATRLFHLEEFAQSPGMAHGWAAWNAFLVWVPPHVAFYRLFKEQYAYAVAQCAHVDFTERTPEQQPFFHLGNHLMLLYGRGQLGLDEDQGLLRRFLNDSNPDIRRHAIGFVGRSLDSQEEVPEEVVRRFMALWDLYWAGSGRKDAQERPEEWLFGAWFSSRKFPEQWALERLEDFVRVAPTPQPDHGIAEQLAKTCEADIVTAVRILDRMVQGDREGWRIYGWRDAAKQILEKAMHAGDEARKEAERIINYLGRRGYTDFGVLLHVSP